MESLAQSQAKSICVHVHMCLYMCVQVFASVQKCVCVCVCILTWSIKHHIEVHAVDTDTWIVLDAQIDVLLDTKTEVSRNAEVIAPQLVLLHLHAKYTIKYMCIHVRPWLFYLLDYITL